jgi:prepilin-type N-terminal cleavage/methylation domain-containing protein
MKNIIKRFSFEQQGFTILELLVVIAIMGILAAIVVPSMNKHMATGNVAADQTEEKIVQNAVYSAMAFARVENIAGSASILNNTHDLDVSTGAQPSTLTKTCVGYYITNGISKLSRSYNIASDGTVTVHTGP